MAQFQREEIPLHKLLSLNNCFPNVYTTGAGIFDKLMSFDFNPDSETADTLNLDYFGNYSGDKVASKLLHRMADPIYGELSDTSINKLARMITMRFTGKWNQLWEYYAIQPWFDNINIEETESTSGSETTNKDVKANESETDTRNENISDDIVTVDSITNTRSGSIVTGNTGTDTETTTPTGTETVAVQHSGTISDNGKQDDSEFSFGFNTTGTTGNLTGKDSGTDSNTRTFNNTDTTTTTPGVKREQKLEYGLIRTQSFNNLSDVTANNNNSKRDKETKSNIVRARNNLVDTNKKVSSINTRSNKTSGYDYRRQNKIEELTKLFDNPHLFPFFEILYEDIDSILTIPVYK